MKMLTPHEVADRLNVSYDTALRIIKSSGIPYLKIGRQYRVSEQIFNDLVNQNEIIFISYDESLAS